MIDPRSSQVITRRNFLAGASSVAIATALLAASNLGFMPPARAQSINYDELAASGPLEDRMLGKPDAPVMIVEYASMTCGHCAAFHAKTYPELKKRYIDTGKVRFVLRDFPLDALAAGAFTLARCADKDKYYPIVETLFESQKDWAFVQNPRPALMGFAKQFGFTEESFNACVTNRQTLTFMEASVKRASQKFGVNSTPTIFVADSKTKTVTKLQGAASIDEMAKAIDPLLGS